MERYTGTCERLCDVDPSPIRAWLRTIPYEQWPQQDRMTPDCPYPSMLCDRRLEGYYTTTQPFIDAFLGGDPALKATDRRMSVVVPGQRIFRHTDMQLEDWRVRIHIPVETNSDAIMFIEDVPYHMEVGGAYAVNTEREHHLHNLGPTHRVHFFFDIRAVE